MYSYKTIKEKEKISRKQCCKDETRNLKNTAKKRSSNVNEVIKTILSQCFVFFLLFFFLQKDIARTKILTSKNQLKKQKSTNTKQKQQLFARTNSYEDESHLFCPCLQRHITLTFNPVHLKSS